MKKGSRPGTSWFRPAATLDLHRLTVAESEEALTSFLDKQFLAGKEWVLVVHGAKTLSSVVERILSRHPLVEDHEPDNPGATRVRLSKRR